MPFECKIYINKRRKQIINWKNFCVKFCETELGDLYIPHGIKNKSMYISYILKCGGYNVFLTIESYLNGIDKLYSISKHYPTNPAQRSLNRFDMMWNE